MPRLTEATAAKRRMHILDATAHCLFERGLLATSVDNVCTQAGISKGAFYSHFPSRDALIHAVTDMLAAELGPIEDGSIATLADSVFERRIAPALPPAHARFGIEVTAASTGDSGLRERNTANLERLRHAVEAAAHRLIAAGKARADADAATVGWLVQAHVMGVLCRNAVWPAQDAAALRRGTHLLLESLLAPVQLHLRTDWASLPASHAVGGAAMHSQILAPVVVLVAWTLVMLVWTIVTRVPAMKAAGIDMGKLIGSKGTDADKVLPPAVQWKAHNYNHLHEQPTLFYAIALTLALLGQGQGPNLWLAWAYVLLRIAHSLVQATFNKVSVRFLFFLLSTLALVTLTASAGVAVFAPAMTVSAG